MYGHHKRSILINFLPSPLYARANLFCGLFLCLSVCLLSLCLCLSVSHFWRVSFSVRLFLPHFFCHLFSMPPFHFIFLLLLVFICLLLFLSLSLSSSPSLSISPLLSSSPSVYFSSSFFFSFSVYFSSSFFTSFSFSFFFPFSYSSSFSSLSFSLYLIFSSFLSLFLLLSPLFLFLFLQLWFRFKVFHLSQQNTLAGIIKILRFCKLPKDKVSKVKKIDNDATTISRMTLWKTMDKTGLGKHNVKRGNLVIMLSKAP